MVSEDEVKKIATLARLKIEPGELLRYSTELSSILEYIDQLKKIDVEGIEAMTHVHGQTNVFRNDEVRSSMDVAESLRNAPDVSGQFIRVPIIQDQSEESSS